MATRLQKELEFLARAQKRDEAAVLADAIKEGIHGLFVRHVRESYVRGKLSRREAIRLAGAQAIQEVDEAWHAVEADVKWGFAGE